MNNDDKVISITHYTLEKIRTTGQAEINDINFYALKVHGKGETTTNRIIKTLIESGNYFIENKTIFFKEK
jgi:hypothetical protein